MPPAIILALIAPFAPVIQPGILALMPYIPPSLWIRPILSRNDMVLCIPNRSLIVSHIDEPEECVLFGISWVRLDDTTTQLHNVHPHRRDLQH